MNRPVRLLALIVLASATAACSVGPESIPGPTAIASPSPSLTPGPSASLAPTDIPVETPAPAEPTPDPAVVLAANGIGPYVVGASLSDLESRGLVANVTPSFHCDASWQGAEATGRYAGQLSVTFHLGRLIDVHTNSTEFVTPSGARVGMTMTELETIYGSRGTPIKGDPNITGTTAVRALSVRVPDTELGIVFFLDESNTKAQSMSAGEVERLEQMAVFGEGC